MLVQLLNYFYYPWAQLSIIDNNCLSSVLVVFEMSGIWKVVSYATGYSEFSTQKLETLHEEGSVESRKEVHST